MSRYIRPIAGHRSYPHGPRSDELDAIVSWYICSGLAPGRLSETYSALMHLLGAKVEYDADGEGQPVLRPNEEMVERLAQYAESCAERFVADGHQVDGSESALFFGVLRCIAFSTSATMQTIASGSWFDQGMPTIEVGHKAAASLMVTGLTEDVLEGAKMPFNTFYVTAPTGMLFLEDGGGVVHSIRRLRYSLFLGPLGAPMYFFDAVAGDAKATALHGAYRSLWELFASDVHGSMQDDPFRLQLSPGGLDDRNSTLARRLLVNLGLLLTEKENYKAAGRGHERFASSRRRWEAAPTKRVFKVTKSVSHDFRSVVSAYGAGNGKKLNLQSFVMGHWKMQAHGQGRSLRERLFVEAYWRGPEDAPIAKRSHKLCAK